MGRFTSLSVTAVLVFPIQVGCSGTASDGSSTAVAGGGGNGPLAMGGTPSVGGSTVTGGNYAIGGMQTVGATVTSNGGSVGSSTTRQSDIAGGTASGGAQSSIGGNPPAVGGTGTVVVGTGTAIVGGNGGVTSGGSTSVGGAGGGGTMPLVYDTEDTGTTCPKPVNPAFNALTPVPNLPDPFLMTNGTRIATRAEWTCRRAEISSHLQYWGTGPKGAPPSNLTASYSGSKLTVNVAQGSASLTLTATITVPTGTGPFPVVIGMNTPTGSLPADIFTSRGIATMTFTSSQLVPDGFNVTRGSGTYFTMYPDKNTGAMIEWAWGVSRIIDGLQKTASQNKIDTKRIAVTGCSYQGKMALYAGAFDERIALVIPQESGGGGEASWRFMATQTGTEDLEAAQGTAWYAANLKQFKNADAPKLPYDQHELVALIAPRAVLAIANTGIDRLGSQAGYVSMRAASEIYKALSVGDRIGYTQTTASGHCMFPATQRADVEAFVDKFLLGKATNTAIAKSPYTTDLSKWITWATPSLK